MLESFKYINHMKEELCFGNEGIFVNENELRDYSWNLISENNKITGFKKGIVKKAIPIIIACQSEEEGIKKKNSLAEIFDKDVLEAAHGKIIIGDYYLKCFVTGSKKSDYLVDKRVLRTELEITTDCPFWIKEKSISFGKFATNEGVVGGKNLDFNNDFSYDYLPQSIHSKLNNTGFVGSNFKMIIYGDVSNPAVTISGHEYKVNVDVGINEYLTIDSISKKIYLTHIDGSMENVFNKRNRESYIFQKIPAGNNSFSKSDSFGVDVVLMEERSEPKWI